MKTQPSQKRSEARVANILEVTEQLILDMPLEEITPTQIARRADITRTSLYHFFPSKFDIFDVLASKYYAEIQERVIEYFTPSERKDYREAWSGISCVYSRYFNDHPAAAILLLGRKDDKRIAYTDTRSHSEFAGDLSRLMEQYTDMPVQCIRKTAGADVFHIVVELFVATFSFGMRKDGRISKRIEEEAGKVSLSYIDARLRSIR